MCPSVDVDDEVWEFLKANAEPFADTPNSVLRRALGLDPVAPANGNSAKRETEARHSKKTTTGKTVPRKRAPVGSLLPESEYEQPILEVLAENGGQLPAREVVRAVGERIADRLKELDREELQQGGQRWENRVQFTRLRLKERGLIVSGSPRGLWELSQAGHDYVMGEA